MFTLFAGLVGSLVMPEIIRNMISGYHVILVTAGRYCSTAKGTVSSFKNPMAPEGRKIWGARKLKIEAGHFGGQIKFNSKS